MRPASAVLRSFVSAAILVGCGRTVSTESGTGVTGGTGGGISTGVYTSAHGTGTPSVVSEGTGVGQTNVATGVGSTNATGVGSTNASGVAVSATSGGPSTGSFSSGVGPGGVVSSALATGSSGIASSSSGIQICSGFGDACTNCLSTGCSKTWCDCANDSECIAAFQCWNACNPQDQTCINACTMQHAGGVSQAILVENCASEPACQSSCSGGEPQPPCSVCIYTHCAMQMNACFADPECLALNDCIGACPPNSVVCQNQCYMQHGAGAAALQAVIDCSDMHCTSVCM